MHKSRSSTGAQLVPQQPPQDLLLITIVCLLSLLIASCGARDTSGGGASGDVILTPVTDNDRNSNYRQAPLSCQLDDMKSWVLNGMLDYYLFADQVDPNTDLNGYDSLENLIIDLRVAPHDTFSYITDEQSHTERFTAGENIGFGWVLERSANNELYFKLLEEGSPLATAGFVRGEQLVSINDMAALDFLQQASAERDAMLSSEDNGISAQFTVRSQVGALRTRTVSKARYDIATVLDNKIIEHNGSRVAYLHFYQFLDTASAELAQAFEALAAANISELVLDMRYNLGGKVSVAAELASYLLGRGNTDKHFAVYQPNAAYSEFTSAFHFVNRDQALNLNRVFVLQTDRTCSAAELVVNGLRPFLDVITIGSSSCGKPYASIPNTACDKTMNALELEAVNAAGIGGYYNGIAADCIASDDLSQALGSTSENLLSSALNYLETGTCPSASTRTKTDTLPLPAVLQATSSGISIL